MVFMMVGFKLMLSSAQCSFTSPSFCAASLARIDLQNWSAIFVAAPIGFVTDVEAEGAWLRVDTETLFAEVIVAEDVTAVTKCSVYDLCNKTTVCGKIVMKQTRTKNGSNYCVFVQTAMHISKMKKSFISFLFSLSFP